VEAAVKFEAENVELKRQLVEVQTDLAIEQIRGATSNFLLARATDHIGTLEQKLESTKQDLSLSQEACADSNAERATLYDLLNAIRTRFVPEFPIFRSGPGDFFQASQRFLAALAGRIVPPWTTPVARIAQLEVLNEELTSANSEYAKEKRDSEEYQLHTQRANETLRRNLAAREKELETLQAKHSTLRNIARVQAGIIQDHRKNDRLLSLPSAGGSPRQGYSAGGGDRVDSQRADGGGSP
jgi:septal ring factor EnvC (AmiA/AmiB activator)